MHRQNDLMYLSELLPIQEKNFPDQLSFLKNRHLIIDEYSKKHGKVPLIVLSTGTYDLLTQYHLQHLITAKKLFSNVIHVVSVDTDEYVKLRKGSRRPIRPYSDRVNTLSLLDFVDYIVPDNGDNESLIRSVSPDYLVMSKSTTQESPESRQNDISLMRQLNGITVIFPMLESPHVSTTGIIKSVLEKYSQNTTQSLNN